MASHLEAEVRRRRADVAELADAYGLGPYALWLGGSSPSVRTIKKCLKSKKFKEVKMIDKWKIGIKGLAIGMVNASIILVAVSYIVGDVIKPGEEKNIFWMILLFLLSLLPCVIGIGLLKWKRWSYISALTLLVVVTLWILLFNLWSAVIIKTPFNKEMIFWLCNAIFYFLLLWFMTRPRIKECFRRKTF